MKQLDNPYGCSFCQESFSKPIYLVNHVQNIHEPVKLFEGINRKAQDTSLHMESTKESIASEKTETKFDGTEIQNSSDPTKCKNNSVQRHL